MTAKTNTKMDALVFIDTNIFLDFYRIRKTNVSMKYLEEIEKHKELIIINSQVEMEFKKNRQSVILESLAEVRKFDVPNLSVPMILNDTKTVDLISKSKNEIKLNKKKLTDRIEKILKNPNQDPVYKSLEKLFSHKSEINLSRENKLRFSIRNLAKKRFVLGYPPRKKSDNSIGDAINWEWIIYCAQKTGKQIILVTRDTDFGAIDPTESYLNDWLNQEFKERVGRRRKIILTDKLSQAFKLLKIPVSTEMIEEEQKVSQIIMKNKFQYPNYLDNLQRIFEIETAISNLNKLSFPNISNNDLDENQE
jgi:predicted nucleic acid-binding protein